MANSKSKTITVGGEKYILMLFRILSRDDDNIPVDLSLCREDIAVEVCQGDEFMSAWVMERMVSR